MNYKKMNAKRWSTIRDFYTEKGGKHAEQMVELLPDEMFYDSNIKSRIIADVMLSMSAALEKTGKIEVRNIKFPNDPLDNVMTAIEAAEEWGVNVNNLKWYCRGVQSGGRRLHKRFYENEARRSGKVWLIKRSAMVRLFGESDKMKKMSQKGA